MFNGGCRSHSCSSSSCIPTVNHNSDVPIKKTIHVLDNELRLRSITANDSLHHVRSNSSALTINGEPSIGRFDELTHFFNIINGLFHQSAFTFGLSTYHLAPLFCLPELNIGVNMNIDQQSLKQYKIDLLRDVTLYGLLGRQDASSLINRDYQRNKLMGIVKFHTFDENLMLGLSHRWSPSLTTTLRFRAVPQKKLSCHIEYRRPQYTYELISEYSTSHSPSVQFSCLSCLWQRDYYRLDGGIDLRITSREKLADIGLRLKRSSDSIIYKCDLFHPLEHYLIGFQRYITSNFIVGVLAEKLAGHDQQQAMKFSLMSEWNLKKTALRINTLANTRNELGISFIYQLRHFPLVFQTFGLYSWTTRKCKWGVGLQLLI